MQFTERELDVLREITSGDTNQEIADRLNMSVATVKTHILNMLEKTGFRNRTELAVARAGKRAGHFEPKKLNQADSLRKRSCRANKTDSSRNEIFAKVSKGRPESPLVGRWAKPHILKMLRLILERLGLSLTAFSMLKNGQTVDVRCAFLIH